MISLTFAFQSKQRPACLITEINATSCIYFKLEYIYIQIRGAQKRPDHWLSF